MITREDKKVTPAKQIIYVGTKDLEGTQEFVVTQPVPFETEYVEDSNIEAGKTEIKQQGQNGEKTVTYKEEAKNGQVTSHKATEEITKDPVKQIIRVGTKSEKTNTEVVKENIPFETRYEEDPNLPVGETRVETPGEFGSKTTTTSTTLVNGETKVATDEKVTKQPVNQVVKVGTKLKEIPAQSLETTKTEEIPYTTIIRENENMQVGSSKVLENGENGETTIKTTVDVENGVAKAPVISTEITKEAKPRIIEVGTKPIEEKVTEKVPFETEVIFDNTMPLNEKSVSGGVAGEKVTTINHRYENGQIVTTKDEKNYSKSNKTNC